MITLGSTPTVPTASAEPAFGSCAVKAYVIPSLTNSAGRFSAVVVSYGVPTGVPAGATSLSGANIVPDVSSYFTVTAPPAFGA